VTAPLIVSIPHRLGREEAVRRLKHGLQDANIRFADFVAIDQQNWTDNSLQFQLSALGQVASGTIDVLDDCVRLELRLPWLLAQLSERLLPSITRQTTQLLEKK
jgi:hypothetical protein